MKFETIERAHGLPLLSNRSYIFIQTQCAICRTQYLECCSLFRPISTTANRTAHTSHTTQLHSTDLLERKALSLMKLQLNTIGCFGVVCLLVWCGQFDGSSKMWNNHWCPAHPPPPPLDGKQNIHFHRHEPTMSKNEINKYSSVLRLLGTVWVWVCVCVKYDYLHSIRVVVLVFRV